MIAVEEWGKEFRRMGRGRGGRCRVQTTLRTGGERKGWVRGDDGVGVRF